MDPMANVVIFATVEILKRAVGVPKGFLPFFAVVSGVVLATAVSLMNGTGLPDTVLIDGLVSGLSTVGGYELVMKIIGGITAPPQAPVDPASE